MFRWYRKAKVCYAYLSDVTCTGFVAESCKSRWFTRGWTLQELIAPFSVTFYDKNWQDLGSKRDHARLISEITTIDRSFLVQASHFEHERPFNRYSVAKRMAWAAQRQTTRIEDMAYCLLGLFNVKIPLLYVEGEKAFVRLQEEIIQANDDVSIFAWGVHEEIFEFDIPKFIAEEQVTWVTRDPMLTSSPTDFKNCNDISRVDSMDAPYAMTNLGLDLELPLVDAPKQFRNTETRASSHLSIGILACTLSTTSAVLGVLLVPELNSDVLMHRVALYTEHAREEDMMTFPVDPRLAIGAVSKRIVISNPPCMRMERYKSGLVGHHKFLFNQVQDLAPFQYRITEANHLNIGNFEEAHKPAEWDPPKPTLSRCTTMNQILLLIFSKPNRMVFCQGNSSFSSKANMP